MITGSFMKELISCSEILITAQHGAGCNRLSRMALVVSAGGVFNILLTPGLNTASRLSFIHYTYQLCSVTKAETKDPESLNHSTGFNRG